jgi:site-specific DNA-cytosine methylase
MKNSINVLSLFDGISAGQLALQRAGINVKNYYASEIDKYAIQVTQKNFPNTIQLGDITKWKEWDIPWDEIDLVIGGSPCQGFSFAGKQLNFNDERSKLFFVFVDICHKVIDVNPKMKFLLENVKMKKEYQNVITEYMGVEPISINSSLVSAQNRPRLYWTNISNITQPIDLKINLNSIIDDCVLDIFYLSDKTIATLSRHNNKIITNPVNPFKSSCIHANYFKMGGRDQQYLYGSKGLRKFTPVECERLQTFPDNYTQGISNTQRYKALGNSWTVDVIAHIFSFLK